MGKMICLNGFKEVNGILKKNFDIKFGLKL